MGTLCFDLDGTLCTNTNGAYESAEPIPWAVRRVGELAAAGHRIVIATARGGAEWDALTRRQLERWGIPYDELRFGKPHADVFVDHRALNAADWRMGGPATITVVEVGRTFAGRPLRLGQHAARARALACLAGIPGVSTPARIGAAVDDALADELPARGDVVYSITIGTNGHMGFLDAAELAGPPAPQVFCRSLAEPAMGLLDMLAVDAPGSVAVNATLEGAGAAWPLGLGADGGLFDMLGGQLGIVEDAAIVLEPFHGYATVVSGWLEELAGASGIELSERPITRSALDRADEVFIAGMPFCVLPVATIDDRALLRDSTAGPVVSRLIADWSAEVEVDLLGELTRLTHPEAAGVR